MSIVLIGCMIGTVTRGRVNAKNLREVIYGWSLTSLFDSGASFSTLMTGPSGFVFLIGLKRIPKGMQANIRPLRMIMV